MSFLCLKILQWWILNGPSLCRSWCSIKWRLNPSLTCIQQQRMVYPPETRFAKFPHTCGNFPQIWGTNLRHWLAFNSRMALRNLLKVWFVCVAGFAYRQFTWVKLTPCLVISLPNAHQNLLKTRFMCVRWFCLLTIHMSKVDPWPTLGLSVCR